MRTAQDRYAAMLRDEIAPSLRELGLRGSGPRYTLPSDTHWALSGFQKSQWSDRQLVSFTVNMVVVSRDTWTHLAHEYPALGDKPNLETLAPVFTSAYRSDYWSCRIGHVMPSGHDTWWEISADGESPAAVVIRAIRDHALPAMRARLAITQLP